MGKIESRLTISSLSSCEKHGLIAKEAKSQINIFLMMGVRRSLILNAYSLSAFRHPRVHLSKFQGGQKHTNHRRQSSSKPQHYACSHVQKMLPLCPTSTQHPAAAPRESTEPGICSSSACRVISDNFRQLYLAATDGQIRYTFRCLVSCGWRISNYVGEPSPPLGSQTRARAIQGHLNEGGCGKFIGRTD